MHPSAPRGPAPAFRPPKQTQTSNNNKEKNTINPIVASLPIYPNTSVRTRKAVNEDLCTMDKNVESVVPKKIMSPCDVEALKKCLEENKGDYVKCQAQIEAFKSSCSVNQQDSSSIAAANNAVRR